MAGSTTQPTDGNPASASPPGALTRSGRRWVVLAIVAGAVAVAGVAAAVIATRDDRPSDAPAQLGSIRQACQQWASSAGGPDAAWCTAMTDWMHGQMGRRPGDPMMGPMMGSMMGPMMWQDPDAMRATCRRWMTEQPPAGGGSAQWCDQMVDWMREHMGDWDRWMRDGPDPGG